MWSNLVKIQYTELKLSCGNDLVKKFIYSNGRSKVTTAINRIFDNGLFPHDNLSSVYWIFIKLGHMIPLWKGKNPIYLGVIRLKVKVTVTVNRISDNKIVSAQ
jgi:hypothetical protein